MAEHTIREKFVIDQFGQASYGKSYFKLSAKRWGEAPSIPKADMDLIRLWQEVHEALDQFPWLEIHGRRERRKAYGNLYVVADYFNSSGDLEDEIAVFAESLKEQGWDVSLVVTAYGFSSMLGIAVSTVEEAKGAAAEFLEFYQRTGRHPLADRKKALR